MKSLFCESVTVSPESASPSRVWARFRIVDPVKPDEGILGYLNLEFDARATPIPGQWYELNVCGQLGGGTEPSARALAPVMLFKKFWE